MKLVAGMLVKNEANRFLGQVIDAISIFADELVVLDDQSSDNTVQVVLNRTTIPTFIHYVRPEDGVSFANEVTLRKMLYAKVLLRRPDWLIIIDADEVYHPASREAFQALMSRTDVDIWGFRLYDMWDANHYRSDRLWLAHEIHTYMMMRVMPEFVPRWLEIPQHCGRLPDNYRSLRLQGTDQIRIKHYGWTRPEDRVKKYERNMSHDAEGKYGVWEAYQSILDPTPHLVKWVD